MSAAYLLTSHRWNCACLLSTPPTVCRSCIEESGASRNRTDQILQSLLLSRPFANYGYRRENIAPYTVRTLHQLVESSADGHTASCRVYLLRAVSRLERHSCI